MPNLQHKRGTRAALDALATGSGLLPGQIYVITDESRLAVGLTTSTYQDFSKVGEGGGGGFTESATAPSSPSYGDRWLDTTSGIEYTWVNPGVWVDLSEPTAADVAAAIHAATGKTTPVDADELALADSEASWSLKKLTWANLKAVLLAYFKGQFREKLTASRTYYVRTDGSDSNDGLANTSGGAFLTIQKAIDATSALDNGGFDITIQVGAGTFVGHCVLKSLVGSGVAKIVGAGPTSTTLDASSISPLGVVYGGGVVGNWFVLDLKIQYTGSGTIQALLYAYGGSKIYFGNVNFGGGASWQVGAQFLGFAEAISSYSISGGAASHLAALAGGVVNTNTLTVTITGTPTYSVAFARAEFTSVIYAFSNTYTGSATGKRYQASAGGGIRVFGAGASYLPGNSAGTATSPGWYE